MIRDLKTRGIGGWTASGSFKSQTARNLVSCELTKSKTKSLEHWSLEHWTDNVNFELQAGEEPPGLRTSRPGPIRNVLTSFVKKFDSHAMLENGASAFRDLFRVYYGTWCEGSKLDSGMVSGEFVDVSLKNCEQKCEHSKQCAAFTYVRRLALNTDLKVSERSLALPWTNAMQQNVDFFRHKAVRAVEQCHLYKECKLNGDPPALKAAKDKGDNAILSGEVGGSDAPTTPKACLADALTPSSGVDTPTLTLDLTPYQATARLKEVIKALTSSPSDVDIG